MELTSFSEILFNPVAQVKFIHTVAAGYVAGSMFVLSISAWYLLKGRDTGFAKRSFAIAAAFGTAGIFSVILLGDESGYEAGDVQKYKLAAIEAEWHTEEAPAAFTAFAIPDQEAQKNDYAVKIPYALGIIATRSLTEEVKGLKDIIDENEDRIRRGMLAYASFEKIRKKEATPDDVASFEKLRDDFGYGLLLKRYTHNVVDATEEQIKLAAKNSIPRVAPLFFSFRIMVAAGVAMLGVFVLAFIFTSRRTVFKKRWFLWICFFSLPLPWIAIEAGWFVAEFGRQPWAVGGVLPTAMASSNLEYNDVLYSLIAFIVLYTILLIIEVYLMQKFVRIGPSSLHTGRYHFEKGGQDGHSTGQAKSKPDNNHQELI